MKPRIQFVIIVGLLVLVLGIAWYSFLERDQAATQTFPATIQRDCAPWDGSAFTVNIPMNGGTAVSISIWQDPNIDHAVSYSFPDNSGQVGNASLILSEGMHKQLSGDVSLQLVKTDSPVEGQFELLTEGGQQFKGSFRAEWQDQIVLCG